MSDNADVFMHARGGMGETFQGGREVPSLILGCKRMKDAGAEVLEVVLSSMLRRAYLAKQYVEITDRCGILNFDYF